jgi:hypothetical protein
VDCGWRSGQELEQQGQAMASPFPFWKKANGPVGLFNPLQSTENMHWAFWISIFLTNWQCHISIVKYQP